MHIKLPQNQRFSLESTSYIQEFCASLKKHSLVQFMHDITFSHGQISMLMNDENCLRFYFNNKMPAVCTDITGRTLADGVYLGKILKDNYRECAIIFPQLPLPQNSLHIMSRKNDAQALYSLYFDLEENDFLHWVVNNGSLLNDFIDNYNIAANDLILEAMIPENRTILPLFDEVENNINQALKPSQLKVIHRNSKLPIYLATQQSNVLSLLVKGKSAKEIASDMKLSPRTVEHYLDRIRKLLNCRSNKELIAVYGEQL